MTIPLSRDKAFFAAAVYLAALFLSLIILWSFLLIGGNPMIVKQTVISDSSGSSSQIFQAGDAVTVSRVICSRRDLTIEHFPAIYDDAGNWHPLRGGAINVMKGCHETAHRFIMPPELSGSFQYTSTIKFQTNLVGRDESVEFPPIKLTVFQ